MADDRETRTCAKCGITDTHSHHVQYAAFMHPVTGEAMDLTVTKHTQCCAEDGCPICSTDVEHIGSQPPSEEFTAAMQNKSDEHHQALFERHGIETPSFGVPMTATANQQVTAEGA